MKTLSILLLVGVPCAFAANPEQSDLKRYLKHTYGPPAIAESAAGAGLAHLHHTPEEWGQGAAGFARRFASGFGFHIVKKSIQYPVAKLLKEQYGYHPSDKTTTKARLIYALTSVVITRKTTTGAKTVNANELAGVFGAGFISRLWQPASTRTIGAGFSSAGTSIAIDAAYNVVREFWPEIRHPHSHAALRAAQMMKLEEAMAASANYIVTESDREEE
jgi:hypothetical protein